MLLRASARRAVAAASRRHLTVAVTGASGYVGSYEAGLAGADAVVHAAATVVIGRDPSIASAAVDGVENVLSSLPPECKTFVLTSSIAAVISLDKPSLSFDEDDWNDYSNLKN